MASILLKMLYDTRQECKCFFVLGFGHGDPNLMTKAFQICYEKAYPILTRNLPQIDGRKRELLYHFISQGSGGVLTCWIRDGMKESPEEIIDLILMVCNNALGRA